MPNPVLTAPKVETKAAFRVVIAYEDFASGKRAMDACKLLMAQLEHDVEFRTSMWKFDLLRNLKLNQIAVGDAIEADVIMVAASANSDLPIEIKKWIEGWSTRKHGQVAALVALLDFETTDVTGSSIVHAYLKRVAAAAEIDFLSQVAPFLWSPAPSRATATSAAMPVLEQVFSRPALECWGLND